MRCSRLFQFGYVYAHVKKCNNFEGFYYIKSFTDYKSSQVSYNHCKMNIFLQSLQLMY